MREVDTPSVEESAAAADILQRSVEQVIVGHSLENVICVCSTLLSQAIATLSDDPDQAGYAMDRYADAIKADIRKNWHLVTARRAKG